MSTTVVSNLLQLSADNFNKVPLEEQQVIETLNTTASEVTDDKENQQSKIWLRI